MSVGGRVYGWMWVGVCMGGYEWGVRVWPWACVWMGEVCECGWV